MRAAAAGFAARAGGAALRMRPRAFSSGGARWAHAAAGATAAVAAVAWQANAHAASVEAVTEPEPAATEPEPAATAADVIASLLASGYVRLDKVFIENRKELKSNNIVHDTLRNVEGGIQRHEIYFNEATGELVALLNFGPRTVGLPGVVHGGSAALLFDNTFGWCFFNKGYKAGFTAYLHVNYKKPLLSKYGDVKLVCSVSKVEGRKVFLQGKIMSLDGETVYSDSEALFVVPRRPPSKPITHE